MKISSKSIGCVAVQQLKSVGHVKIFFNTGCWIFIQRPRNIGKLIVIQPSLARDEFNYKTSSDDYGSTVQPILWQFNSHPAIHGWQFKFGSTRTSFDQYGSTVQPILILWLIFNIFLRKNDEILFLDLIIIYLKKNEIDVYIGVFTIYKVVLHSVWLIYINIYYNIYSIKLAHSRSRMYLDIFLYNSTWVQIGLQVCSWTYQFSNS